MSHYLHDYPLDASRREIRLLTILPSPESEAPIECSLQVASLDAFPRYEAISYAWGDIQKKNDILLDGRTIQVPTNVRRIVHRLRHRTQRRDLWIDYVCINQENVAEKNTQVPLMSAIYANATSVIAIISLDNLSDNATDAIYWMKTPEIEDRKWNEVCWRIKRVLSQISVGYERRLAVSLRNIVGFYVNLLFAEYWTRMWTFQEYQLSQGTPPICICGDMEFPAPNKSAFVSACLTVLGRLLDMILKAEERGERPQLRDLYEEMDRYRERLRVSLVGNSIEWNSDKQEFSVLDLLRAAASVKPHRTKYMPYMVFSHHCGTHIHPVYNKSLSQIIFETAKYILNERPGDLEMLDIFCLREDRLENVSIPSWVPDLTTTLQVSTGTLGLYSMRFGFVDRILGTVPGRDPEIMEDHSVLCLSGRPIGKCRPVVQFASDVKSVLAQIMGVIQLHGDGCHMWNNVWEPENIPYRFLRACSAFSKYGLVPAAIRDPEFDSTRLRTVLETLDLIHQDADTVLETLAEAGFEFLRDLVPRLYSIKVFTIHHTSFVGFGLSEQNVEEEDQVIVSVKNVEMPFILRQGCGSNHNRGQVYHKLVGFACVDGICRTSVEPNPYLDHLCKVPYEELLLN